MPLEPRVWMFVRLKRRAGRARLVIRRQALWRRRVRAGRRAGQRAAAAARATERAVGEVDERELVVRPFQACSWSWPRRPNWPPVSSRLGEPRSGDVVRRTAGDVEQVFVETMPCIVDVPPVSAGHVEPASSFGSGRGLRVNGQSRRARRWRTPRRGRIFLHSRRWRATGVRFMGRRGMKRRWRDVEPTGTASSARDALREESPRHGLQDGPLETRSPPGAKCDTRRQREKRSGEPTRSRAPRGSACAPHGASRLFGAFAIPRSSLRSRAPDSADSRPRRLTEPRRTSEDAGQELFLAAQSRCRST